MVVVNVRSLLLAYTHAHPVLLCSLAGNGDVHVRHCLPHFLHQCCQTIGVSGALAALVVHCSEFGVGNLDWIVSGRAAREFPISVDASKTMLAQERLGTVDEFASAL